MLCRRLARAVCLSLVSMLLCFLAIGCGGGKGYRLSGKATFKGQPIASGKIFFTPDLKSGSGPAGYADIKDGTYDTDWAGGHGVAGGPTTVRIEAIDPSYTPKEDKFGEKAAKQLFPPYQKNVDIPKQAGTMDFDVPDPKDAKKP